MSVVRKLDHTMAKKAREVEMDYFRSMGVYSEVRRTEAFTNGCKVISTRWIEQLISPCWQGDKEGQATRLVCCDATSGSTQSGVVFLCVQPVQEEEATSTHEH